MLNKDICIKCREENGYEWNSLHDWGWKGGKLLHCCCEFSSYITFDSSIPDKCFYKMEQMVTTQGSECGDQK